MVRLGVSVILYVTSRQTSTCGPTKVLAVNHPPLLEFNNVSLLLSGKLALDRVSLSIGAGENVAILGPNGSGKSSLIKLVTRDCYPLANGDTPSVRIFGESVWDVFSLRKMLGIVSPDLQQICAKYLTANEVILSGYFGSVGIWPGTPVTSEMRDKCAEILEFLEIGHLAEKRMTEMSGGESRRVLIGRALAHDPAALILDEPTNSLDLHAARKFREVLRKIAQSGKSVIMVTHHLPDIIPEITRVIMIRNGKIHLDAPKKQALTEANMSELFTIPLEIREKNGYYYVWG